MTMYNIISKKRDKLPLTKEELSFVCKGASTGSIPDYQLSALLMAMYLNGLNLRETTDLTNEMAMSGEMLDLSAYIPGNNITFADKHSTGGVGDKVTLIALPLAAAAGVKIAKLSGRALGHTGGTIDKLSAIPGFKTSLEFSDFIRFATDTGLAISGQTLNICPADKKLYALRDVTATVDYLPLIASSVMSKKLASGADVIVLDVKCGNGAFMKNHENAVELADIMVNIAKNAGKKAIAIVSDMSVPLGNTIGNSLEVIESIEVLKNNIAGDLAVLSGKIAAYMVHLSGITRTFEQAEVLIEDKLENGEGLLKFKEFISNQGGNTDVIEDYSLLPKCQDFVNIYAEKDGYIEYMDTEKLGMAAIECGAGRHTKEDEIDFGAGMEIFKKMGDYVNKGDILAKAYYNNKDKILISNIIKYAYKIGEIHMEKMPIIYKIIN